MAAQAGLSLTWSKTRKTGFLVTRLKWRANLFTTVVLSFWTDRPGQNSDDPDQTAPRVWPGSTLLAIPSISFGPITLWYSDLVRILGWLPQISAGVRIFRIITLKQFFFSHPSCCIKGFGIDSMPSAGQISTTEVPRHTTRPRFRVSSVSLNGSSGSAKEWVSMN